MKGVTLFADLFLLVILMVEIILMVGIIWIFQLIYGVESQMGITDYFDNPRQVSLNILYKPTKYESTFLSFLELDCRRCSQKISMKEIMNAVAIQGRTDIELYGESIDASLASGELLGDLLENKEREQKLDYLLKIRDPELIISKTDDLPQQLQKVSTNIPLLNGEIVDLELYVG